MRARLGFLDWPLRAKMAALLVVASVLPLGVAAYRDTSEARRRLLANTAALLAARGDQLVGELDTFHRGYVRSVDKLARLPDVGELCRASSGDTGRRHKVALHDILLVQIQSDPNVRGVAILDLAGSVILATEEQVVGTDLSRYSHVRDALRGAAVISDIYIAGPEVRSAPTIAYLAPVRGGDQKTIGAAVFWVRASSLWELAKSSNELAGPRSFAVMFDRDGIRIAHTYSDDIVFHPGGRLEKTTIDALVEERRLGDKTRMLLEDVKAFPEQFERARSASPDTGFFRGFAPVNEQWNYGVGRRLRSVSWTVFYMIPEGSINAQLATLTNRKLLFAGAIILIALVAGLSFASIILRPIQSLAGATEALSSGDLGARVPQGHTDEIGRLGMSFNAMAGRIEALIAQQERQAVALREARDELELRVQERTSELVETTKSLEVEVVERRRAEDAVRQSEQSLATTLNSIGDAVIATDTEGRVVRMNPVAEQLTGWSLEDARTRPLAEVFHILNEGTRRSVEREASSTPCCPGKRREAPRFSEGPTSSRWQPVRPRYWSSKTKHMTRLSSRGLSWRPATASIPPRQGFRLLRRHGKGATTPSRSTWFSLT
jgi:PAS domain-containing protein